MWCRELRRIQFSFPSGVLAASCLAFSGYSPAEPLRDRLSRLIPGEVMVGLVAQPMRMRQPEFPGSVRGEDGWVQISYGIGADGLVINPVIEQAIGSSQFSKAALRQIRKSVFAPSTLGGQAVAQVGNVITLTFDTQSASPEPWGATKSFNDEFWQVFELLEGRKLDEAEDRLTAMRMRGARNFYEMSRLELLRAEIAALRGDDPLQLRHLRAALAGRGERFMDPRLARDIKERVVLLESQLLELRAALRTFESLETSSREPPGAEIQEAVARIRVKLASGDPLVLERNIHYEAEPGFSRPSWRHELVHRRFAFLRSDPSVDEFEVRCARTRLRGNVDNAYYWEVPVNEKDCQLLVFGSARADLTLVDYPAETPPHDPRE